MIPSDFLIISKFAGLEQKYFSAITHKLVSAP